MWRADIHAMRARFERAGIAMWCNTLDGVACGGFSGSAALARPDAVWGGLIGAGVSVVQTDLAGKLEALGGGCGGERPPRLHRSSESAGYVHNLAYPP